MARISFSALVEEIIGKLGGSVFQDSYGGLQVRTRVSPRNPRTKYQQLRRGEFAFLSASWRNLTSIQRQTFIDAASTPPAALNLFLQSNINLTLVEEPTIDTYVPSSDPGSMPIEFIEASDSGIFIQATGSPSTVPPGTKLLIQVTFLKAPTKIFTNPSQYSPVISFDEGTDLSVPIDILTEWQSRYGQISLDKRVCLKSALIDKSNGLRGADSINCTITEEMPQLTKLLKGFFDTVSNNTTADQNVNAFNIPANTFLQNGDRVQVALAFETSLVANPTTIQLTIDGSGIVGYNGSGAKEGQVIFELMRKDTDQIEISSYAVVNGNVAKANHGSQSALDFTAVIPIETRLVSDATNEVFVYMQSVTQFQQP